MIWGESDDNIDWGDLTSGERKLDSRKCKIMLLYQHFAIAWGLVIWNDGEGKTSDLLLWVF